VVVAALLMAGDQEPEIAGMFVEEAGKLKDPPTQTGATWVKVGVTG
jgi:hypothetical protein